MSFKTWTIPICSIIFTIAGLTTGWYGAQKRYTGTVQQEQADHNSTTKELAPQTLANMGVSFVELKPGSFSKKRTIMGVIEESPLSEHPIYAPVEGVVQAIHCVPNMTVKKGDPLLTLLRGPVARPEFKLTGELLKPIGEVVHERIAELQKFKAESEILETEIKRLEQFGTTGEDGLPLVPKSQVIRLHYDLERTRIELERIEHELARHGLSKQEIVTALKSGDAPELSAIDWKNILRLNGLWSSKAEYLLNVLPAEYSKQLWHLAIVAELSASGLDSNGLTTWLKEQPELIEHFMAIGAKMLQGYSLAYLKSQYNRGAFNSIIVIKAPEDGTVDDWDVRAIHVRSGAHLAAGEAIITLASNHEMYLVAEPIGNEQQALLKVFEEQHHFSAQSLISGHGPDLSDLRIEFIAPRRDAQGMRSYSRIINSALKSIGDSEGRKFRSWKLRAGMPYKLQIEEERMQNVYVLPSDAIADEGPDKIVFVKSGSGFEARKVELLYRDRDHAVIAINARTVLFPGDLAVASGAFLLNIALKSDGAQDSGHGHSH